MRSRPTNIRGKISLIKAGSGLVFGTAELVDCLPPLTPEQLRQTSVHHRIPDNYEASAIQNGWLTPWVLSNVQRLISPRPYEHPSGAVTWVTLPDDFLGSTAKTLTSLEANMTKQPDRESVSDAPAPSKSSTVASNAWADITLTEGNIRNGHFYLRSAEHILPADCIGGSNKDGAAKNILVRFEPGMLVETDIAGDKMILRTRSPIRQFFERIGARGGDVIRFAKTGEREYHVSLHSRANN